MFDFLKKKKKTSEPTAYNVEIQGRLDKAMSLDDVVGLFYFNGNIYFKSSPKATAKTLDGKKTILDVFKENHPSLEVDMSDLKVAFNAISIKVLNL